EHVRHELRRNRHARLVFAILPCVAVIRQDGGDARRRRAAERVDHDQQLDQVLIDRAGAGRACRLHDEDVGPADVLVDLKRNFRIRKPPQARLPDLDAENVRDFPRQPGMRRPRKNLQLAEPGRHQGLTYHLHHRASWVGWGGRIRTFEYGIQSPAPYRLATPQRVRKLPARFWEKLTSGVATATRRKPLVYPMG